MIGKEKMTAEDIKDQYGIPQKILEEYHKWGLCNAVRLTMDQWQYSEVDLERLGMIMALHDMDFSADEAERYMKMLMEGDATKAARMEMLNEKRSQALDEIHLKEKQLERMDYLRMQIRTD